MGDRACFSAENGPKQARIHGATGSGGESPCAFGKCVLPSARALKARRLQGYPAGMPGMFPQMTPQQQQAYMQQQQQQQQWMQYYQNLPQAQQQQFLDYQRAQQRAMAQGSLSQLQGNLNRQQVRGQPTTSFDPSQFNTTPQQAQTRPGAAGQAKGGRGGAAGGELSPVLRRCLGAQCL